jgi:hypothetical protein
MRDSSLRFITSAGLRSLQIRAEAADLTPLCNVTDGASGVPALRPGPANVLDYNAIENLRT